MYSKSCLVSSKLGSSSYCSLTSDIDFLMSLYCSNLFLLVDIDDSNLKIFFCINKISSAVSSSFEFSSISKL